MAVNFGKIQKIIGKTVLPLTGEKLQVVLKKPASQFSVAGEPQSGPAGTTSLAPVNATIIPIKKQQREATTMSAGRIKVLIEGGLPEDPAIGWTIEVGGVEYRVGPVSITKPGVTTLLYSLECER